MTQSISERAANLLDTAETRLASRTDKSFAVLMVLQWIAAVGTAFWITPYAWEGLDRHLHPHVYAAIFLCGAATLAPVLFAWRWPGSVLTRHVIAVG